MSDVTPQLEDDNLIGATSQDVELEGESNSADDEKKSFLQRLTVFDAMLAISLLFITFATFRLVLVLREYSPGWPFDFGSPWSTGQ